MMCRHEFLQALVRIASALYVETGVEGEVAVAVSKLCSRLQKALPPEALQDSNAFRKQRCYNELCDMALRRHQPSLRAIFDVYARSNRNTSDELQDSRQMSVGEWLTLLEHVGLLQMGQVSYFGAKMTFKVSALHICAFAWLRACHGTQRKVVTGHSTPPRSPLPSPCLLADC